MKDLLKIFIGKRIKIQTRSGTDSGVIERVDGDYLVLKHIDEEERANLPITDIKGFTEESGEYERSNTTGFQRKTGGISGKMLSWRKADKDCFNRKLAPWRRFIQ